jgi:cysteine synthase A
MRTIASAAAGVDSIGSSGILAAIGNTPLVPLANAFSDCCAAVFAKLEMLNPMGSAKDRAVASMLLTAIRDGAVIPGRTTVIESTSGNTGVALAAICKYFRLPLICVTDGRMTGQHGNVIRALGAIVEEVTVPDPATGELLPARIRRVQDLLREIRPSFWPNQYGNPNNAIAHRTTFSEIVAQLGGAPDYVFCATGTCGTLRGCADAIAARGLPTQLIAVDAIGSRIFSEVRQRRLIPGLGSAIRPPLVEGIALSRVVHISEGEAVAGSRRLLETEAILAGGSSGAVISALGRCEDVLRQPVKVVVVLADAGERYLDTIFDDAWVAEKIGIPESVHV